MLRIETLFGHAAQLVNLPQSVSMEQWRNRLAVLTKLTKVGSRHYICLCFNRFMALVHGLMFALFTELEKHQEEGGCNFLRIVLCATSDTLT